MGRKLSSAECSSALTRLRTREWMGPNNYRTVYLKLTIESGRLDTFNRKGDILRSINLKTEKSLTVIRSTSSTDKKIRPLLLIKLPETYDLGLEFQNDSQTEQFVTGLKKIVEEDCVSVINADANEMFDHAETRETRQKKMDQFFKEAYSMTFGIK